MGIEGNVSIESFAADIASLRTEGAHLPVATSKQSIHGILSGRRPSETASISMHTSCLRIKVVSGFAILSGNLFSEYALSSKECTSGQQL